MFEALVRRLGGTSQSIGTLLITCMAIGFASLVAAGLAAAWSIERNQNHSQWVAHTYEVELAIAHATILIEQTENPRRGYIIAQQPIYMDSYRRMVAQMPGALDRIATLTVDNPRQQANVARLRLLIADLKAHRDLTNRLVAQGHVAEAIRLFAAETSGRRMRAISALGDRMKQEEQRLLAIRDADQRASLHLFFVTLSIAGLLLLLVAIASLMTILRYTRDLAASRDRLRDFAESLEDQVRERTADLSRANEEIQRFAYIVSHDLRSPLVNVMGFTAELEAATASITELIDRAEAQCPDIVTEEARTAARVDLPEATGFIRTSAQKMDRLISAILRLSREGRRVISPEPLAMTALVETIDASLKHLTEARGVRLVIEPGLPDIVSDRLAIEQILSNLIENAVKYLQPGRPGLITVRGRRTDLRIDYEVEDNGRGIAAADHSRIFDLFRRSGNQDQVGEGIGLAHVRALAYRLGGSIDVSSELGRGSIFRLSLPASFSDIRDH